LQGGFIIDNGQLIIDKLKIKMSVKKIIQAHSPFNETEEMEKESFIQFLNSFSEEQVLLRSNLIGHLTASAWVVNKNRNSVLMAHHNIYKTWAWLGGHADGDKDMLYVAKKEAKEESGLSQISVINDNPIDISVLSVLPHIKKGKVVQSHLHFNVTYLLEANEDDKLFCRPEENSGVKWIKNEDILSVSPEKNIQEIYNRIMEKVKLYNL